VLGVAWLLALVVQNADFRDFFHFINHDEGAVLAADQAIVDGKHPGVDFWYCYGLLPVLVARVAFALLGHTPSAFLLPNILFKGVLALASGRILARVSPTRFGVLLTALAVLHALPTILTPTHSMEAALISASLLLWLDGRTRTALVVVAVGVFVKVSMPTVILAEMCALVALRALRERRLTPLVSLLVAPATLAAVGLSLGALFGFYPLRASEDPFTAGRGYAANNAGFFREGRTLWDPARHVGHALNWYLGSYAGSWILGAVVLVVIAIPCGWRIARSALRGEAHGVLARAEERTEELVAICGGGHLAYVLLFFGLAPPNYNYLLLLGLSPLLAKASVDVAHHRVRSLAFAVSGLVLAVAASAPIRDARQRLFGDRVQIGGLEATKDEAVDWTAALTAARALGSVGHVGYVSNFSMIAPDIREVHYWIMMPGMTTTPSVEEARQLDAHVDAVIFSYLDDRTFARMPEFDDIVARPRVYEGPYFRVVRGGGKDAKSTGVSP
jgi:hypothetical protein